MSEFKTWYYRQPSALRTIVTINVAVYVLAQVLHLWPAGFLFLRSHFALHPVFPDILFEPWQLVSYNFMHTTGGIGGLLHIGFNMLWLFWIGREFERMHGSHQFWTVYLVAGVGGGIMCLLLQPLFPTITGDEVMPVVGASASVLGVLMTVAILYPYKKIGLLFFGVVRLLYLVVGFLIIDALLMLSSSGTAVAAHWGGALTGYLYAKVLRDELKAPSWLGFLFRGQKSTRSRSDRSSASPGLMARLEAWLGGSNGEEEPSQPSAATDGASDQSNDRTKEVDRILDKISEHGYESLSEDEKRILYEASQS